MTARETGLYYLQSRYYNPTWGRFLNADVYVSTGQGFVGNNMFAYCLNNPINMIDRKGEEPISITIGILISVGVAITAAMSLITIIMGVRRKPANLPARKKMTIDIEHVVSGHMAGGKRNPSGKKSVFWGLTAQQITKAIYEAYDTATKIKTQGSRILVVGYSETFNLVIEMWINIVTYIIETAYPK